MSEIDSSQILDGTIVNADINSAANIALSKLENGTRIPVKEANGDLILSGTLSMDSHKINNGIANTDNAGFIIYSQLTGAVSTINATITSNQAVNLQPDRHIVNETPSGTVNGTNTAFTLANSPVSGKVQVFKNGLLQLETDDYTISGSIVTFVAAPLTGSKIRASYIKA